MRILFLIFFTGLSSALFAAEIKNIRKLFFESENNPSAAQQMIQAINESDMNKNPVFKGYKGTALTMSADESANPFEKLRSFNEGKALLEEAIRLLPDNFELRFLRFSVQSECPSFLSYTSNLTEDKKFILKNWPVTVKTIGDNLYIEKARQYLLLSKELNATEKQSIKNGK